MSTQPSRDWKIFKGNLKPHNDIKNLPEPPGWRSFGRTQDVNHVRFAEVAQDEVEKNQLRGATFRLPQDDDGEKLLNLVNAALYLRRPLLITGKPGTGKTSIAYAIAHELNLGSVLVWPITGRSTLREGLYQYDAIARLQDAQALQIKKEAASKINSPDERAAAEKAAETYNISIGDYFTLGPLGTAFLPYKQPRVLLIDEVDKSDINLPNDLLNLFEEGEYKIPELARLSKPNSAENKNSQQWDEFIKVQTHDSSSAWVKEGRVRCYEFPIIILTSNGERDFPPAFLRRCLRITMPDPSADTLTEIVKAHLKDAPPGKIKELVSKFIDKKNDREGSMLAPDQLLNVVYLLTRQFSPNEADEKTLTEQLLQYLE